MMCTDMKCQIGMNTTNIMSAVGYGVGAAEGTVCDSGKVKSALYYSFFSRLSNVLFFIIYNSKGVPQELLC